MIFADNMKKPAEIAGFYLYWEKSVNNTTCKSRLKQKNKNSSKP